VKNSQKFQPALCLPRKTKQFIDLGHNHCQAHPDNRNSFYFIELLCTHRLMNGSDLF
jgi:hypothetical protein